MQRARALHTAHETARGLLLQGLRGPVRHCARAAHRANQFIEFELDGMAVTILGILNQKYHQECDDRRTCVDDQLPCIAELEYRACDAPDYDDQSGDDECSRMARGSRRLLREAGKRR